MGVSAGSMLEGEGGAKAAGAGREGEAGGEALMDNPSRKVRAQKVRLADDVQ